MSLYLPFIFPLTPLPLLSILKPSKFTLDGQATTTFFDMTNHLGIYIETAADVNDALGHFWANVDFHPVAHVEHLVHLAPVGAAAFVDDAEQWRNIE